MLQPVWVSDKPSPPLSTRPCRYQTKIHTLALELETKEAITDPSPGGLSISCKVDGDGWRNTTEFCSLHRASECRSDSHREGKTRLTSSPTVGSHSPGRQEPAGPGAQAAMLSCSGPVLLSAREMPSLPTPVSSLSMSLKVRFLGMTGPGSGTPPLGRVLNRTKLGRARVQSPPAVLSESHPGLDFEVTAGDPTSALNRTPGRLQPCSLRSSQCPCALP